MAEMTLKEFVQQLSKESDEARLALAKQLKNAGLLKVAPSSTIDADYYKALVGLEEEYKQQASVDQILGTAKPAGRYDVLTSLIYKNQAGGGDGSPTTTTTRYITSASQTAKLLDNVAQDLLGRKLTKAEKAKYTSLINKEQQASPSTTTSGKGFSTTRGGVDEQAFIEEKIGATAEAKTNSATDAYAIMMEELGGLR
jgi:histidyl-tRNA synthetase